ncbi:MAG: DUF881 domain-containing protein [Clostridiaceae bacterium]
MKIARNIAMTMVCVLLGIMLALQYKSINVNQSMASFENKRMDDLKTELIKLQNQKDSLQQRLQELEEENQTYARVKAGDSDAAKQIQDNLKNARIFAGLETVKGKGIIVTLDNNGLNYVEDYDILDVVNELRASGAQAISVNDERIVAMTEIRGAGSYVMINGKQFNAPFTIKAISDPDDLERSLNLMGGVLEGIEDELNVAVKKSDEITIYKFVNDNTTIKTNLLTPVD